MLCCWKKPDSIPRYLKKKGCMVSIMKIYAIDAMSGEGVQLEISRGLREKMFDNLGRRRLRKRNKLFFRFVETLREALR